MLSIAKLARGRESYYLETVASSLDGRHGLTEPEGRWVGRGAARLSLSGDVEAHALRALMIGVDPSTGEVLSPSQDRVRVAAYDCTYSTPKSVSVLHALGPEEVQTQIRAGHERAAAAALGYLERAARVRRSAPGGRQHSVGAEGFVAASFLHRTSRAPDPHLHSHVLVANLAQGPDGRWSALDGRCLYLELVTARHLYETHLRGELTGRLGVSWRELQGSWADLVGIDQRVNQAFSRRSEEIKALLRESGEAGPQARRIAAARTRTGKDLTTPYEQLVTEWRERSYGLGVSDARIAAVASPARAAADGATRAAPGGDASLQRWVRSELGVEGTLFRQGACTRSELIRSRCATLRLGAPVDEIEGEIESLIAKGRLLPVGGWHREAQLKAGSGGRIPSGVVQPLLTTPELLSLQRRLAARLGTHRGTVELCAYEPGGRLRALDALSSLAATEPMMAVAPGRRAAGSFESTTGIETTDLSQLRGRRSGAATTGAHLLVVAEAHRLGPFELDSILGPRTERGERTVLVAPTTTPARLPFSTLATLWPGLPGFTWPNGASRDSVPSAPLPANRLSFGGREVLVASDTAAARDAMVEVWSARRASGEKMLLVSSDAAVIGELRERVVRLGGAPGDVLEMSQFARAERGQRAGAALVLGGVPERARGRQAGPVLQVAVVPDWLPDDQKLGRAAEVCRAPYLVAELGALARDPEGRAAWRAGAARVETFRRAWGIEDPERATGTPALLRSLGSQAVADAAECRFEISRTRSVRSRSPLSRELSRDMGGLSR